MIRRVYWRLIAKGSKDMINISRHWVKIKASSWLIETIHYQYRKKVPLNVGIKKKKKEVSSLLIMIEKIFSRPKSRTEKTFFKGSCKFDFMKKLSVISNISCKKQSNLLLHLWLGAVIQGQCLPRLRINSLLKTKIWKNCRGWVQLY